jgi:hypothetical protein
MNTNDHRSISFYLLFRFAESASKDIDALQGGRRRFVSFDGG